ncbi:MAG: hypothetical protein ACK4PR_13215, partial [Gammaproteobacteria bacterium]
VQEDVNEIKSIAKQLLELYKILDKRAHHYTKIAMHYEERFVELYEKIYLPDPMLRLDFKACVEKVAADNSMNGWEQERRKNSFFFGHALRKDPMFHREEHKHEWVECGGHCL